MFRLLVLTWPIARISVISSTRAGIPFRGYVYSGSTEGRELYIFNIPFMDSLSFPFLLFASDCMALVFGLPHGKMAE
jgi:hypothetical protein